MNGIGYTCGCMHVCAYAYAQVYLDVKVYNEVLRWVLRILHDLIQQQRPHLHCNKARRKYTHIQSNTYPDTQTDRHIHTHTHTTHTHSHTHTTHAYTYLHCIKLADVTRAHYWLLGGRGGGGGGGGGGVKKQRRREGGGERRGWSERGEGERRGGSAEEGEGN